MMSAELVSSSVGSARREVTSDWEAALSGAEFQRINSRWPVTTGRAYPGPGQRMSKGTEARKAKVHAMIW